MNEKLEKLLQYYHEIWYFLCLELGAQLFKTNNVVSSCDLNFSNTLYTKTLQ